MAAVTARVRYGTPPKLPAHPHSCVLAAKQRSPTFVQRLAVGVQCIRNRGSRFSQAWTLACRCVAARSAIKRIAKSPGRLALQLREERGHSTCVRFRSVRWLSFPSRQFSAARSAPVPWRT